MISSLGPIWRNHSFGYWYVTKDIKSLKTSSLACTRTHARTHTLKQTVRRGGRLCSSPTAIHEPPYQNEFFSSEGDHDRESIGPVTLVLARQPHLPERGLRSGRAGGIRDLLQHVFTHRHQEQGTESHKELLWSAAGTKNYPSCFAFCAKNAPFRFPSQKNIISI